MNIAYWSLALPWPEIRDRSIGGRKERRFVLPDS
jgi:hypothetical protein